MLTLAWGVVEAFGGATEAREIRVRRAPDFPDVDVACTAKLTVDAAGAVTVDRVVGCKAHAELVRAAVSEWRYAPAPAPTQEEVALTHRAGQAPGVRLWIAPEFGSALEAADGRGCVAHLWLAADGALDRVEVTRCGEAAATTFADTLHQWVFDPGPGPREALAMVPGDRPAAIRKVPPAFPTEAPERAARCEVLVTIGTDGFPTVDEVVGCPPAFASAATDAVVGWRWEDRASALPTVVAVSFVRD